MNLKINKFKSVYISNLKRGCFYRTHSMEQICFLTFQEPLNVKSDFWFISYHICFISLYHLYHLHCKTNTCDENFWSAYATIFCVSLYSLDLCPWTFPHILSYPSLRRPSLAEQLTIILPSLHRLCEGISILAWKMVPSEISGISASAGLLNMISVNMWPFCLKKGTFLSQTC